MFIQKLKKTIRNKAWVFLKASWKLRSGISIAVQNDNDWFVFNEIFANKEYDQALTYLLGSKLNKPLILDLGANVGYFTLKVADELYQAGISDFNIIALEAAPSNYNVLRQRVDQFLLKNKARSFLGLAGYKTGKHSVVHSNEHYGHSAVVDHTDTKAITVDYIDIEKLIDDPAKKIDFLKCDIEGSEEIFIKENFALLERTVHCVFEFHSGECDVPNCRKLLQQAGLISKGVIKEDPAYKTSVEIFSRH